MRREWGYRMIGLGIGMLMFFCSFLTLLGGGLWVNPELTHKIVGNILPFVEYIMALAGVVIIFFLAFMFIVWGCLAIKNFWK